MFHAEKERKRNVNHRNPRIKPKYKEALYKKAHFNLIAKTPRHCQAIRLQMQDVAQNAKELQDITLKTYDASIQGELYH